jgi:hypothetical protein
MASASKSFYTTTEKIDGKRMYLVSAFVRVFLIVLIKLTRSCNDTVFPKLSSLNLCSFGQATG